MSLWLSLWALGPGCGSAQPAVSPPQTASPAAEASSPSPDPSFTRELEELKAHAVEAPTGAWTSRIEAKTAPSVSQDGATISFEADLGIATPVRCSVVAERRDHGATVTNALERLAAHVEVREVEVYAFDADEHQTAIFVRALVALSVEGQTHLTGWKMMVARTADQSMLCTLPAAGYRQTFVRVAGGFARAMKSTRSLPPADRVAVWAVTSAGAWVGHVRQRAHRDAGGGLTLQTWGTVMLPTSESALSTSDFSAQESLNAAGELLAGQWVERAGEGAVSHFVLQQGSIGYDYQGLVNGARQAGRIEGARFVNADVYLRSARQRVASGAPTTVVEVDEYHPDLDPARAFRVGYRIEKLEDGARVRYELGPAKSEEESDAHGRLRRSKTRLGELELDGAIVFERGEI